MVVSTLWKGPCIIPCCTTGTHFYRYPSLSNINVEKEFERYRRLDLIKRFVPFPPRPKAFQLDLNSDPHIHPQAIPEEYPSKDGFENNRQLNVIARRILIHPDLVNLWKQIGYYE